MKAVKSIGISVVAAAVLAACGSPEVGAGGIPVIAAPTARPTTMATPVVIIAPGLGGSQQPEAVVVTPAPAPSAEGLSAEYLAYVWPVRHLKAAEALAELEKRPAVAAEDIERAWQIARLVSYVTSFHLPAEYEANSKAKEISLEQYGIDVAAQVRAQAPNRVEGHYWWAQLTGQQGQAKGIMASLGNAKPMEAALNRAAAIDEQYNDAGPLRIRGRLYFKLPRWGSIGDKQKALNDLTKAYTLKPDYRLNRIYLAESLIDANKKAQAKSVLENVRRLPEPLGGVSEEADWDSKIDSLLGQL